MHICLISRFTLAHLEKKQPCQTFDCLLYMYTLTLFSFTYYVQTSLDPKVKDGTDIIELVDSICRDSADTQYMLIQTNFSKSPKQLIYKPL